MPVIEYLCSYSTNFSVHPIFTVIFIQQKEKRDELVLASLLDPNPTSIIQESSANTSHRLNSASDDMDTNTESSVRNTKKGKVHLIPRPIQLNVKTEYEVHFKDESTVILIQPKRALTRCNSNPSYRLHLPEREVRNSISNDDS